MHADAILSTNSSTSEDSEDELGRIGDPLMVALTAVINRFESVRELKIANIGPEIELGAVLIAMEHTTNTHFLWQKLLYVKEDYVSYLSYVCNTCYAQILVGNFCSECDASNATPPSWLDLITTRPGTIQYMASTVADPPVVDISQALRMNAARSRNGQGAAELTEAEALFLEEFPFLYKQVAEDHVLSDRKLNEVGAVEISGKDVRKCYKKRLKWIEQNRCRR